MGCGSLSTTAVPSSYGTFGEVKGQNFTGNKDKSFPAAYDEKKFYQSDKGSRDYSPVGPPQLKSESGFGVVRNASLPVTGSHEISGSQMSRFTMSMKEIDEDKHKDDDGGIWLGTEENGSEETPDQKVSTMVQLSVNENCNSSDLVKHEAADVSDKETKEQSVTRTVTMVDGQNSNPADTVESNVKSTDNVVKPLPATASFIRRSQTHKHLKNVRAHYDSVEDGFSNSYGHYDDDKQMSDSELDNYTSGLLTDGISGNDAGSDYQEGAVRLRDFDDDDDRDITSSRLPGHVNEENCNIESDFSVTGITNKELGVQSPFKTREMLFDTFNSRMSLESLPVFPGNPLIPHFMVRCVSYIEAEGLKTEGLYRISGNRALGEQFLNTYSADPEVDIAAAEIPVHVIATLLKSFVNNLKEALIPASMYDELVEATAGVPERSSHLATQRDIIRKLPPQQFEVLKYICDHLHKVAQYQEFNSMNSKNLAKCWWPTLIRLQFRTYENLKQGSQIPEEIVQTLIEQCEFIFHDGNEL